MGFLSPWFLGGLLAAGCRSTSICCGSTRPMPLPFSSLMFFEQRTQSSVKHRRLKYLRSARAAPRDHSAARAAVRQSVHQSPSR